MAKIHFLGTASGTEPIYGLHHTAIVLETNGVYYWFDAGENCSRLASVSGIDLLRVKAVFISHPHMDHIGGLANLLWNMRKFTKISDRRPIDKKITLTIPSLVSWEGAKMLLGESEENFKCDFDILVNRTTDGTVYEDENIKVTAFHNHHIQQEEGDGWLSYSFLIEIEGKKIVFSGDVRDMYDLDAVLDYAGKCDLLMVETGHHKVLSVCDYVNTKNIKNLIFTHHGREIINGREEAEEKIKNFNFSAKIAYDGMVEEI